MRLRQGLTMIETVIALGLLTGLAGWWLALGETVLQTPTAPTLTYYQAAAEMVRFVSTSTITRVNAVQCFVQPVDQTKKARVLEQRVPKTGRTYFQFSGADGDPGYTPLLFGVTAVRFESLRPGVVAYILTLTGGAKFEGVLRDATAS